MTKKITSWSWTRYADYRQCPAMTKYKHIDRLKEPKGPALERGAMIHDLASGFIKGTIKALPPELKNFAAEFRKLKAMFKKKNHGMTVEDDWAFTKDWQRTLWNDWSGCVVRIKLDCAHPVGKKLIVTDWKTGKYRDEDVVMYQEQLELYALAALILHPKIEVVHPRLVYLDAERYFPGSMDDLLFEQKDVVKLKKLWAERTQPMLNDTVFAKRATDKCRWCWFGQSKKSMGGPGLCEF